MKKKYYASEGKRHDKYNADDAKNIAKCLSKSALLAKNKKRRILYRKKS